ncbi:hypothetical protein EI427_02590 [Flammeovirga pectinis]|uniref:DUF3592 domain-containing protein n=1 Tax=Flammeovirga pectinis TaxID=2494373 RepID=A0A3S9NYY9_9BACT|nr:DUF3592 domain-containing protein [Flammeovirga pectinis]AZQ61144.1 hypothetical protein EI427_02590 [Flammeovirga pectinis]
MKLSLLKKLRVLMNGTQGLLSAIVFTIGCGTALYSFNHIDFDEYIYLSSNTATSSGVILDVYQTSSIVNDEYVYRYDYEFELDGISYYWSSYNAGYGIEVGDKVKIEYNIDKPEVNRIAGMSNTNSLIFFYLIPFIIGLIWFSINVFFGRRKLDIIEHGVLTDGRYLRNEMTSMEINDKRVYKYFFSYKDDDNEEHELTIRTHSPEFLFYNKSDNIIYHSNKPDRALFVDNLSGSLPEYVRSNLKKEEQF